MPDAQGGIQTIMMEMLAYSRPGVIEVLPAVPPSLVKGSIKGMLARCFARIDNLSWDMEARTVDLTVTSVRKQDIALIARQGIETISVPAGILAAPLQAGKANVDVHLPEGNTFSLETVAIVLGKEQIELSTNLMEALHEGAITFKQRGMPEQTGQIDLQNQAKSFTFQHDRIQQAAYSLIPNEKKKETHLKIGRQILKTGILHE